MGDLSFVSAAENPFPESDRVEIAVDSDFRMATTGLINYFLGFLGLLAVFGIIVGTPAGIILIVLGVSENSKFRKTLPPEKHPTKMNSKTKWGIIALVIPIVSIIVIMLAFAIIQVLMAPGDPYVY